jgi:hypothetical protein
MVFPFNRSWFTVFPRGYVCALENNLAATFYKIPIFYNYDINFAFKCARARKKSRNLGISILLRYPNFGMAPNLANTAAGTNKPPAAAAFIAAISRAQFFIIMGLFNLGAQKYPGI